MLVQIVPSKKEYSYSIEQSITASYFIKTKVDINISLELFHGDEYLDSHCSEERGEVTLAHTLLQNKSYELKVIVNQEIYESKEYVIVIEQIVKPQMSFFNQQWALMNKFTGVDINILPVWACIPELTNIVIGVVDTGIDFSHPNLKDRKSNLSYNFVHNMQEIIEIGEEKNIAASESGHATHIAGIITTSSDTLQGTCGVIPKAEIVSLKVLGSKVETVAEFNDASVAFINAIRYAQAHNIHILNCSFNGNIPCIEEQEVMRRAKDILFIISAGNDGENLTEKRKYPACYEVENSIVVGACDVAGQICKNSNYGENVDIAAPGYKILSIYKNHKYISASATSVARPFVTSICALMKALDPTLSPVEIKQLLLMPKNITYKKQLQGKVKCSGIVNAYKVIRSIMDMHYSI